METDFGTRSQFQRNQAGVYKQTESTTPGSATGAPWAGRAQQPGLEALGQVSPTQLPLMVGWAGLCHQVGFPWRLHPGSSDSPWPGDLYVSLAELKLLTLPAGEGGTDWTAGGQDRACLPLKGNWTPLKIRHPSAWQVGVGICFLSFPTVTCAKPPLNPHGFPEPFCLRRC